MKRTHSRAELAPPLPPAAPAHRQSDERSTAEHAFAEVRADPRSWFSAIALADIEGLVARRLVAPELWWFAARNAHCLTMGDNRTREVLFPAELDRTNAPSSTVRTHDARVMLH